MQIGIFGEHHDVDQLTKMVDTAATQGFTSFWTPQVFNLDALTALALVGSRVPTIRLGTAVIPIQARHVMMLAQQALTTSQIIGDRLALGIGLSHRVVIEDMWGLSFDKPFSQMREYLEALSPLLETGSVSYGGEQVTARGAIGVKADTPDVLIAALGPKMLELAGQQTAGTITWMTGPQTIANHINPTITAAAESAGRSAPEVVAAVPALVTDDVPAGRATAASTFAIYGQLPSYQAMIAREGLNGPEDLAIIGSADQVAEGLAAVDDAGATTVVVSEFGNDDERAATRELLQSLND